MKFDGLVQLGANAVGAAQRQLPSEIRPLARNVAVHYGSKPAADVLADGFESDILGLFMGEPHGSEGENTNPFPPQILLYLENIWDFAQEDAAVFAAEVRLTYLHELGHYLGWDEDDLAARGLE